MDPTRLPKIMIHLKPGGRKQRGRPRRTWKDGIYTAMTERDLRMGEWNNRRRNIYIYIYCALLKRLTTPSDFHIPLPSIVPLEKTKVMRISRQPSPVKIMIDQKQKRMWNLLNIWVAF
jgi:hypothetical protein